MLFRWYLFVRGSQEKNTRQVWRCGMDRDPLDAAAAALTGAIVAARNARQVGGIIDAATFRLMPGEIREMDAER